MKNLQGAYKKKFGKPDSLIQLKSKNDSVVFDLAIAYPIPDEDMPDSGVTSLGLSSISDKEGHSVEFMLEVIGKVSDEAVNEIGAVYYNLFTLLEKEKEILPGSIYRSMSLPFFDHMNAVMLTDKEFTEVEWLDEKNEEGRLMRLIPLFEKEADELEQYQPEMRNKLVLRSNITYRNPKRKPLEIAHAAFLIHWNSIATWYKENKVSGAQLLKKALNEKLVSKAGDALENKLKFKLSPDFKTSFNIQHGNVKIEKYMMLNEEQIIGHMNELNDLNENGEFKNALKKMHNDSRLQKQWWHEKWVPIGFNCQGDRLCIDMAPGPDGVLGQVIVQYVDEGPMASGYNSFFEYLDDYDAKLNEDEYEVNESGNLTEI